METPFLLDLSIVIISYNTKDLLRNCLNSVIPQAKEFKSEIIVVDNGSSDGSAAMVSTEFPFVILIQSKINLGFGAANNVAFRMTHGRYLVLINSDAVLHPFALKRAFERIETNPKIGLGGAKLVSQNGSWQPSARMFPSLLNDFLYLTGTARKYPSSKFFGRADRTWTSADIPGETDWVPGAFSIVSHEALQNIGFFDERFFLYYEEVDLCKRLKLAGYSILYWPDVVVTHFGGESAKTLRQHQFSRVGMQLTLWSLRSMFLYYRKHHGALGALGKKWLEQMWFTLRAWKNRFVKTAEGQEKVYESKKYLILIRRAWRETKGGQESPPRPW